MVPEHGNANACRAQYEEKRKDDVSTNKTIVARHPLMQDDFGQCDKAANRDSPIACEDSNTESSGREGTNQTRGEQYSSC